MKALSPAVIAEIERLGGIATPKATLETIVWPEGVTYRTTADHRDDRDVWWARFDVRQEIEGFLAFGTSHGGKVLVCVSKDESADPVVWLLDREKSPTPNALRDRTCRRPRRMRLH